MSKQDKKDNDSIINTIFCKETKPGNITVHLKCKGYRNISTKKLATVEVSTKNNILEEAKYCENYNKIKEKYPFDKPSLFVQLDGYYARKDTNGNPLVESKQLPKIMLAHILKYLLEQKYEYLILHAAMPVDDALKVQGLAKVYARDLKMDLLAKCIPTIFIDIYGNINDASKYASLTGQYQVYYVGKIINIFNEIKLSILTTDKINFSVSEECWNQQDDNLTQEQFRKCGFK